MHFRQSSRQRRIRNGEGIGHGGSVQHVSKCWKGLKEAELALSLCFDRKNQLLYARMAYAFYLAVD